MGASASDLQALGMPFELAKRAGDTLANVTCVGTAQTGAALLTGTFNVLTTSGGQTAAVLPTHQPLRTITVTTPTSTTALIFPPLGGTIQGGSANASFSVAQNKVAIFTYVTPLTIVANLSA